MHSTIIQFLAQAIQRTLPLSWLQLAVTVGPFAFSAPSPAALPETLDYNAAFIGMAAPDRVGAGEVFAVTITLRNTGTQPWEGWPLRLRSINPKTNTVWGTDYILIAQGTTVRPGDEYTFRSQLKAPNDSGRTSFQWQVCKDAVLWFGQATPTRAIEVLTRPVEAGQPAAGAARSSEGKALLNFTDFEYAGSFKPPKTVGNARGAFSESGLALRPGPDGGNRLLMNYTHPAQVLFETEIPSLVKMTNSEHAGLNTAQITKVWGAIKLASGGESPLSPNGGFAWNEQTRTLVWTWYHGYKTGDAPPVLGATRLAEDGQASSFGPCQISAPGGLYKSYWGGVIVLPRAFAEQYTGGKTLALGFGGYYSICAAASRGPALGVISEPDPRQTSVPVIPLLYHPHHSPAARDGDYFNANCSFWSEQPRDPGHGTWSYDDWCRAGVFIETPSAHAYLALVRLGTGRLGYDFGAITSAGSAEYWYLYDPRDLGAAAAGQRQPWQTTPTSKTKVSYPLGRTVTGACFDPASRLLYLCVNWAYPDGRENYPIIHAYRVK